MKGPEQSPTSHFFFRFVDKQTGQETGNLKKASKGIIFTKTPFFSNRQDSDLFYFLKTISLGLLSLLYKFINICNRKYLE